MSKQIECFFDFGSPATYLVWTQLPALAAKHNAKLVWRPMLLGAVFKATGNQSPAMNPAKGRYMLVDFQRYAESYGVPMKFSPFFPINTMMLMRGAVALQEDPRFDDYLNTVFTAIWVEEQNMGQPEVVASVLQKAGFDAQVLLAQCSDEAVKEKLKANTEEAVARGAFGAPTIYIDGEMFFGQDRLPMIEKALS
ncbi:2-hydroxychromene-2-carboxylate isomerase [Alcanivorax sp. 1008]|uniref:2-hydroxychromene-2-carboxylate isomerase n=1 Tax=Alcanivorax sp. 1008 TaxID=2816853 RepID=UPI001D6101D7|nr:2-hydroxychromene-2-carboxylate isomerase [Alcanivorax sp. 1008]MCC1496199.1 2-hydroxychromene-2-carboxylate isomerase [Alcanivorax sp. 1008]